MSDELQTPTTEEPIVVSLQWLQAATGILVALASHNGMQSSAEELIDAFRKMIPSS